MIKHMFKLMWNRKRTNLLLTIEILLSYLVLFVVCSFGLSSLFKYNQPLGFEYENTWVISPSHRGGGGLTDEQIRQKRDEITRVVTDFPEVGSLSWMMGCIPYGGSRWITDRKLEDRIVEFNLVMADSASANALGLTMLDGRWFGQEDLAAARTPVVLSKTAAEMMFADDRAVGNVISDTRDSASTEFLVIGVCDEFRFEGEFGGTSAVMFQFTTLEDAPPIEFSQGILSVRDGVGIDFEERLSRQFEQLAPGWNFRINTLSDKRSVYIRDQLLFMLTPGLVAVFLIFNVALGLFGILWYSINRRRGEIGLRRATGANHNHVSRQILGESMVLGTFGIVAGLFLAVQAPVLGIETSIGTPTYFIAMLCSAALIYFIVTVCALYPSRLATRIQPAEALHVD